MNFWQELILKPLGLALGVSFLLTPGVIWGAKKIGLVTDVKKRKHPAHTHKGLIPRGGGLAVFLAILAGGVVYLPWDKHLMGVMAGAGLLVMVGLLDDKYDLSPYLRMGVCLLAAGAVIWAGIGIAFVNNPLGKGIIRLDEPRINFYFWGEERSIWLLSDLLAILWIVWMTNIVNWAKGFDGQLPGIVAIAALTVALLSLKFSADITQWPVTILAAILAGAWLGFLPFNFYPQKIMPGWGGGALAGYMLAVLAILSTTKVGTTIVVLGVPMIDAFYTVVRRVASGRSPVWGDRGHLHHRLLDLGWGKRKTALFYWLTTAILGGVALGLSPRMKLYTIVMIAILIGGLLLWLRFFTTWSNRRDQDSR